MKIFFLCWILKPDMWINYVYFDKRIFNLDFNTLFLEIKQKLTELWELEDESAPNLQTRGPIQF